MEDDCIWIVIPTSLIVQMDIIRGGIFVQFAQKTASFALAPVIAFHAQMAVLSLMASVVNSNL